MPSAIEPFASEYSVPSEPQSPDSNGKRKKSNGGGGSPQPQRKTKKTTNTQEKPQLVDLLVEWRNTEWRRAYSSTGFMSPNNIIMPDSTLQMIVDKHKHYYHPAGGGRFTENEEDLDALKAAWPGFVRYGESFLEVLNKYYNENQVERTRTISRREEPETPIAPFPIVICTPTVLKDYSLNWTSSTPTMPPPPLPPRTWAQLPNFEGVGVFQVQLDKGDHEQQQPTLTLDEAFNVYQLASPDSESQEGASPLVPKSLKAQARKLALKASGATSSRSKENRVPDGPVASSTRSQRRPRKVAKVATPPL